MTLACLVVLAAPPTVTNSLGMTLGRIAPGTFSMGSGDEPLPAAIADREHLRTGDLDEHPQHRVTISRAYHLGVTEVTNAQYEQFDPHHRALRGKLGFSTADDEAVVYVTWHDAVAFCRWLSRREGRHYRLPTEAEWEYAARAGTTTPYWTGDAWPDEFGRNQVESWFPDPDREGTGDRVPLTVAAGPANPWGLFDVHGNVEEWCADWYGPYEPGDQTDPVGRAAGDFRVTRGGSHGTLPYYLRSANRSGALPGDRSWLIGFRVCLAEPPAVEPLPPAPAPLWARGVEQVRREPAAVDLSIPLFAGPRCYVDIPPGSLGPLHSHHNHCPALVECPNGDLLALWYTCVREPGRELAIAASRLRHGATEWDPADLFWDAPDRNDHATALWADEAGTLWHFNGVSAAATWGNLATILRRSQDSGATWSQARLIAPEHGLRHMPIESVFRTREGIVLLPCDAVTGGDGGTALLLSPDNGATWHDPGGTIAGIHAGVVQLRDGRLMALGRGDTIDGQMPKSISADLGRTWTVTPSGFPPIGGGQRLVLTRLREGPLLFVSFENEGGRGMFAAVSDDEGETWHRRRLVPDGPPREAQTTDGRPFTLGPDSAEPRGYLSVHQGRDGRIHLISSWNHYVFNLAWLRG